jgi:hypothetical protein
MRRTRPFPRLSGPSRLSGMADAANTTSSDRLYLALYRKSIKRLKRRGLSDEDADRVARVVARKAVERAKAPNLKSDKDFASVVSFVCGELSKGKSFYDLIGERPYLATGRIDRLVATSSYAKPPVPAVTALAAKKAAKLERLPGSVAVIFMAAAIVTLGPLPALAVGMVVAAAAEIYVQLGMPVSIRIAVAQARLPRYCGVVALLGLGYSGYDWLHDREHLYIFGAGIAVAAVLVGLVVPGFTLAVLVGRRERKWQRGLEKRLVEVLRQRA